MKLSKLYVIIFGFYNPEIVCSSSKLNESPGTRGQPFELCKNTVHTDFCNMDAHFFTKRVITK